MRKPSILAIISCVLTCCIASSGKCITQARSGRQLNNHCITDNSNGVRLSGVVHLSAWVKTYDSNPTVVYSLDNTRLAKLSTPGRIPCHPGHRPLPSGKHTLSVIGTDRLGRVAGRKSLTVVF